MFRLGLLGLLVVAVFSVLMIGTFVAEVTDNPVSEASEFSKLARVSGFGVYLVAGLALIVPSLADLSQSKNSIGSSQRVMWTLFILIFPFIGPYIYYALYCRNQSG